ncbi:MAG: hypothetical protein GY807_11890 [Gammaproteobacteria bacterium]|nr:hypothetical protein [Gammaproteobacteria bacterium]
MSRRTIRLSVLSILIAAMAGFQVGNALAEDSGSPAAATDKMKGMVGMGDEKTAVDEAKDAASETQDTAAEAAGSAADTAKSTSEAAVEQSEDTMDKAKSMMKGE